MTTLGIETILVGHLSYGDWSIEPVGSRLDQLGGRGAAFAARTKNVGIAEHRVYSMTREASGQMLLELLDLQIDFALRLLLGVAVTRLKKAEQFAAFAVGEFNIVISQLAPMRPNLAIEQLLIFFDSSQFMNYSCFLASIKASRN
jgi:hypothetical protein